jgi:hypothetical protein
MNTDARASATSISETMTALYATRKKYGRKMTFGISLAEYEKKGANHAWDNIDRDLDSRARGRAAAMVA